MSFQVDFSFAGCQLHGSIVFCGFVFFVGFFFFLIGLFSSSVLFFCAVFGSMRKEEILLLIKINVEFQ